MKPVLGRYAMRRMTSLLPLLFQPIFMAAVILVCTRMPALGASPEIWFAPPDNMIVKRSDDFEKLFTDPALWALAQKNTSALSVSANWLVRADAGRLEKVLSFLAVHHLKLIVALPALAVDKRRCGDGVEGTTWPGEAGVYVRELQKRKIIPDFIGLDLPLTSGHLYTGPHACNFSVEEAAEHLAQALRIYKSAFPSVRFIDAEVPTGIPLSRWQAILTQWIPAVQHSSGIHLDAMVLDVWWEHPWQQAVAATLKYLHANNVSVGIFLDSDGHPGMSGEQWITDAKRNACDVRRIAPNLDFVVIANWTSTNVPDLPETQPDTLTSLLDWYAGHHRC